MWRSLGRVRIPHSMFARPSAAPEVLRASARRPRRHAASRQAIADRGSAMATITWWLMGMSASMAMRSTWRSTNAQLNAHARQAMPCVSASSSTKRDMNQK